MSRTGGMAGLRQERFDKILVGAQIGSWHALRDVRNSLVPLESHLGGDVGGVLNGVGARAAPDFVVSMAREATRDNDSKDCAQHETTDTGSNDDTGRYARMPYEMSDTGSARHGQRNAHLGVVERQVSGPPPPLCRGPLVQARPSASVRLRKKGDAQDRATVQFKGFMSLPMIWYGGWRAGATIMVNGGRPFLGTSETSVH